MNLNNQVMQIIIKVEENLLKETHYLIVMEKKLKKRKKQKEKVWT